MKADLLIHLPMPTGPPLHLERPGAATKHLGPFLRTKRITRMKTVLDKRTQHLAALVEHIHNPHNVAACVRSCDAFGVQDLHVITQEEKLLMVGREVSRGAVKWVTVRYYDTAEEAVSTLRERGYRIGATDLGGDTPPVPLAEVEVDTPLCICFGNEHAGISDTLRSLSDFRVQIPMHGFVESLNISVACAITLFTLRQRLDAAAIGQGLAPPDRAKLLDRWIFEDIPGARSVLEEVARRKTLADAKAGVALPDAGHSE
ncbi:MAG: tRNA (guanosine-2'-O-)-methyltransferase [Myxococcota bacterium]|jgi:tRNA (guanosine-2'-O-)-methyltransferase